MGSDYQYYVEGECEKNFLKALMYIKSYGFVEGRVEILNFVNTKLSYAKAKTIKRETKVVIVFDTDTTSADILFENLETLKKASGIKQKDIFLIPSVNNFEDELVCSCSKIKNINDLFKTRGIDEFKKKFIKHKDLFSKLKDAGFDINKMWIKTARPPFDVIKNDAHKIKK